MITVNFDFCNTCASYILYVFRKQHPSFEFLNVAEMSRLSKVNESEGELHAGLSKVRQSYASVSTEPQQIDMSTY